jgi:uncharacterized cupin superfamily protein
MKVKITQQPDRAALEKLGVFSWPIWTKEESNFPWFYDEQETFYMLEGDVILTPEDGEPARFGKGDLVVCPAGMACTWEIHSAVRKHYRFGE